MSRDIQLVVAGGPQSRPRARLGNTASRWGELIPGRLLISSDIDGILEVEQPFEVPPSVKDTAEKGQLKESNSLDPSKRDEGREHPRLGCNRACRDPDAFFRGEPPRANDS